MSITLRVTGIELSFSSLDELMEFFRRTGLQPAQLAQATALVVERAAAGPVVAGPPVPARTPQQEADRALLVSFVESERGLTVAELQARLPAQQNMIPHLLTAWAVRVGLVPAAEVRKKSWAPPWRVRRFIEGRSYVLNPDVMARGRALLAK